MALLRIRDNHGNVHEVLAIKGENYILTDADREEIARMINEDIGSAAADLTAHKNDKENPHGSTAAQVGAVATAAGEENNGKFLHVVDGVATWVMVGSAQVGAVATAAGEENNGKFLRVVDGVATWVTVGSAEGGGF